VREDRHSSCGEAEGSRIDETNFGCFVPAQWYTEVRLLLALLAGPVAA